MALHLFDLDTLRAAGIASSYGFEKDKAIIEKNLNLYCRSSDHSSSPTLYGDDEKKSMVILRLFCSDGIEGLGEATTIGDLSYGEASPEGIRVALESYLIPTAKGMNALLK